MTKADIQLLYQYDRWANNRVLESVSALTDEQFSRDLGGAFPSVRDTLLHIIAGEWGWLQYWKEPDPDEAFLADLWDRRVVIFSSQAFPDPAAVKSKWTEVEREQLAFVAQLTDESVAKLLPFRKTQASLQHLMQHVANHSTYHRGQITLMLRQLGLKPLPTDFHEFLAETAVNTQ